MPKLNILSIYTVDNILDLTLALVLSGRNRTDYSCTHKHVLELETRILYMMHAGIHDIKAA